MGARCSKLSVCWWPPHFKSPLLGMVLSLSHWVGFGGGGGGGIWLLVSDVRVLMMEWGCCGGALHLGLVLLRFFWGSFFFFLGGGNSVCVSNSPALVCGRGAVDPAGIRCEMGLIQWVVFV